jgi:hypothetical protein
MKKFLASTAVLAAIVAGSIGVANAQSTSTSTSTTSVASKATANAAKSTTGTKPVRGVNGGGFSVHADTIAKALGITTTELQTSMQSGKSIAAIAKEKGVDVNKVIAANVAEETAEHPELTAAQVTQQVTDRINGVAPTGGPGGPGGMGGRMGGPGGGMGAHTDTIAKALGITTTELQTAMQSGKSIAAIAKEKGVDVNKVIAAYVAEETAEHPELTAAQVTQQVTDRINGVAPTGGPGGGRGPRSSTSGTTASTQTKSTSTAATTAV